MPFLHLIIQSLPAVPPGMYLGGALPSEPLALPKACPQGGCSGPHLDGRGSSASVWRAKQLYLWREREMAASKSG